MILSDGIIQTIAIINFFWVLAWMSIRMFNTLGFWQAFITTTMAFSLPIISTCVVIYG